MQSFDHLGGTSHIAEIGGEHYLVELDILTFDERFRVNEKIGNDEVEGVILRGICSDNDSREVDRDIIDASIEGSKTGQFRGAENIIVNSIVKFEPKRIVFVVTH